MSNILTAFKEGYEDRSQETMTVMEYLELCKAEPKTYATAAERMLDAIGEPQMVDTAADPRLSRIFSNRKIKVYPAFRNFFGMETAIEQIVSYFKHAAQGLEEKKQILYLLGPVGGGKSSLAEALKKLMEANPIYTIEAKNATLSKEAGEDIWETSPVNESVLGMFDKDRYGDMLTDEFGIPERYLGGIASAWLTKRLAECDGDLNDIRIVKKWPSVLTQTAIAKTEPGDENNQDISSLVGKVDIRKLEDFSQDDPDAYSYAGGLNMGNQGVMEFVEMFKAPIKMLHPLLTATQEGNYNGTQGFGAIPFDGVILAHSNESEWEAFRNNKTNEAFLDRVYMVNVPYCMRIDEEIQIYEKLLSGSQLASAKVAPGTLEMLATWSVLTRLVDPENSNIYSKARVYNGENLKDIDPKAKSVQDYRDAAGINEGMNGMSTRFAFKILSKVFNYDSDEVAANPVHLLHVLEKAIEREQFQGDTAERYVEFLKGTLAPKYAEFIGEELQKAYLDSYGDYGQNLFDRYVLFADHWIQDKDYRDPDTGEMFDRANLNEDLEKIEKAAGISNPKDFRNEVVNFVLRAQAANGGNSPKWTSYEKLRTVIEKKMFSATEDLLPVITFGQKKTKEDDEKQGQFVERMIERGYTEKQVRLLVEWYQRYKKHS
jgi:serine protein kinase